jgi:hypothetical protein
MRGDRDHLVGLAQLHEQQHAEGREAAWRRSMATLAASVTNRRRPVPLEGLDPRALASSVRTALQTRLIDDLDWLSAPASAAALYELAAALPAGPEKRELGRRVLQRLHQGDAATFVALATQLALGSRRALSGAPLRARVALSLDLPLGSGARVDGLALALISRRELEREWLRIPSTGSLPARRLAARLLERAARETARRAAEGDDSGVRVFQTDSVHTAWERLLHDRESLVWRHVATARGLLSYALPDLNEVIHQELRPGLTPTEWRRAGASLAASIAIDPDGALQQARGLLGSPVLRTDPGVATAMLFGLPRAAEAHPAAVEELLEQLVRIGGVEAAEALVELRRERLGEEFGDWATQLARAELREALLEEGPVDDGRQALIEAVGSELREGDEGGEPSLRDRLADALETFADQGASAAYAQAQRVLEAASDEIDVLEQCSDADHEGRRRGFKALRQLDLGLCETDTLSNLLMLGARNEQTGAVARPLGDLFHRMNDWLIRHESEPLRSTGVPHFMLRMRRLRTLLHLIDADGSLVDDRAELLQQRRVVDLRTLFTRVRDDQADSLRRARCAATSRACDALVREEMAEVSDVVLATGLYVHDPDDIQILAEASMVPDIEAALRAYLKLAQTVRTAPTSGSGVRNSLDALHMLANDLPVASSPRVEALRSALLGLNRALETVASASSLEELAGGGGDTKLAPLEAAMQSVAELVVGARRRLGETPDDIVPAIGQSLHMLDFCVEGALKDSRDALDGALASAAETLRLELPPSIADVAVITLERVRKLPTQSPSTSRTSFFPAAPKEAPLPPWMPPGRMLGGFYVLRSLGSGAVGSVFVARRVEERKDPQAETFALKVPEYDADAARTLSEEQFLQLFREEAGALLALPQHPNLARFVTFDAGARPKPILVMELVEGPTLERVLEMGELDMERAIELLDGVAAGLEAMHSVGIGHLDVKPSNVILREWEGTPDPTVRPGAPVLVDFGLAGRHVRPGCGTAEYGAPELWGQEVKGYRPMPVDVYAFACIVYELLTGRILFNGPHETALITQHLSHDGMPHNVAVLHTDPRTAELGELLRQALRRDPANRAPIGQVRQKLRRIAPQLKQYPWPLLG